MDLNKIKLNNRKDAVLYFLIIFSTLLIIYIMFYIIEFYSINDILWNTPSNKIGSSDKLTPNEVGDTIGGILNPVIAFCASILTFLAFYIQYKANKEQREIYNKNLLKEKQEAEDNHYVNIEIFKILMTSTMEHFSMCRDILIDFCSQEKLKPLSLHTLTMTSSSTYKTFKQLDFKDLYSSIVFNFKNEEAIWQKDFIYTIDMISYYDNVIDEIREDIKQYNNRKSNSLSKRIFRLAEDLEKSHINQVWEDEDLEKLNTTLNNKNWNSPHAFSENGFSLPDLDILYKEILPSVISRLELKTDRSNNESISKVLSQHYMKLDTIKIYTENYAEELENKINIYISKSNFSRIYDFLERLGK